MAVVDAEFILNDNQSVISQRITQVAQSFHSCGDKGTVVVKINLEQITDDGHINLGIEVDSKGAKRKSPEYACRLSGLGLESIQTTLPI